MAEIMVTPSELRAAAETLRTYKESFVSSVDQMVESEGKLSTTWQGEANDAFHTAFSNDKIYFDSFASLIEQYCGTLETIAQKYEQAETTNTNTATTRTS